MPRRTTPSAALAALALIAGAPAAAQAVTVTATYEHVEGYRGSGYDQGAVAIAAAPGERNVLTITFTAPGSLEVADAGAPLTAGAGCARTATGVVCGRPYGPVASWLGTVDAGDGDDVVSTDTSLELTGGEGDDILTFVNTAAGTLHGGPGNDRLRGGTGGATLEGGPGDDDMDGGPRGVRVTYADHTAPVTASLADGTGGAAGEHDTLGPNVNILVGGPGDDALTGDDHTNYLQGGPGDDRLEGLGGDDEIREDHEADTVLGGDGADWIAAGPGGRADGGAGADLIGISHDASAVGGPGPDRVTVGSGRAAVDVADDDRDQVFCLHDARLRPRRVDAHDVTMGCGRPPGHPRPGAAVITALDGDRGGLAPTLICPDTARAGCAPLTLSATIDGRRVGSRTLRLRVGSERRTQLLPHAGVALRRWRKGGTVRLTATMRDASGHLRRSTRAGCLVLDGDPPFDALRDGPCRSR